MAMTTTRQTPPENGRHGGAVEKTAAPIQPAARHRWLARHNITLLRVSMGAVIFGFGVLKYFPHVSPAENLILATIEPLTLGLISGRVIMVALATVECIIGLSLMIGRGLRMIRYLLIPWAVGILSPAVLLARVTRKVVFPGQGWLEGSWGPVLVGVRGGWQSPAVPEFR
jgi:uncharacterized membrane protein YphA (DoxX/SURF4 family)